jgi:two-component system NtrC family response regulator
MSLLAEGENIAANVLVIDDDRLVCETISNVVRQMGHRPVPARSLRAGLEKVRSDTFDVVFLDVRLPDGSGLDILTAILEIPSSPEVIIVTGFGDPDGAELAIDKGAWSYVEKPLSVQAIRLPLTRAIQYRQEKKLRKPVALKLEGIVGKSGKLRSAIDILAQAADSEANVLLTGETGTGKELFAWAIHNNSARSQRNFVVVDCAALPETLVESVLFGHRKGAFTGADKAQDGLVSQAHGGTLFLDEVCELPLSIQKSFLRVLQERRFRPVGANKEVRSDFRLLAATNRNVEEMVRKGRFRQDLLFRLRGLTVELPSLKEIKEDMRELVFYYMERMNEQYGTGTKGFSPEFWDILTEYDWPGNVRELIQAIEHALISAKEEPTLFPQHLPKHIRIKVARTEVEKRNTPPAGSLDRLEVRRDFESLQEVRESAVAEAEKRYLRELMENTEGSIREATRVSGLSRSRLYTLLKKYKILQKSPTP